MSGVSLTRPVLALILSADILLHIPCCLHFYRGSFSYTFRAGFIFIGGFSLTYPRAGFTFLCWEFLLHIPCSFFFSLFFFFFFSLFFFFFFSSLFFFFFFTENFSYTSHAVFLFIWGASLTDPVLPSFLSGEFFLHIPYWLYFSVGSFSYTSHALFLSGVCLTHPMQASFLSGEFLLHIPCWL